MKAVDVERIVVEVAWANHGSKEWQQLFARVQQHPVRDRWQQR